MRPPKGNRSSPTLPSGATRHPWNTDFAWALPTSSPTTLSIEQKDAFDRDGFIQVAQVLSVAEVTTLVGQLDALEEGVDRFLQGRDDERFGIAERGAITFTVHAVLRSPAARQLAHHRTLVGIAGDLLGPDVNLYWDQAVYKKPEKPRSFPWHQDTGYTFVEPQHYVTCWVALTAADVDNGCPWVLPGAHRAGTLLHRWVDPIGWQCIDDPVDAMPVELNAGDMVVFSSLTPHLTGPNSTDAVRKAYIVQYGPAGMMAVQGDWQQGAQPTGKTPCEDPERQFPVLRRGSPTGGHPQHTPT